MNWTEVERPFLDGDSITYRIGMFDIVFGKDGVNTVIKFNGEPLTNVTNLQITTSMDGPTKLTLELIGE